MSTDDGEDALNKTKMITNWAGPSKPTPRATAPKKPIKDPLEMLTYQTPFKFRPMQPPISIYSRLAIYGERPGGKRLDGGAEGDCLGDEGG
jgi:hypothetical protein